MLRKISLFSIFMAFQFYYVSYAATFSSETLDEIINKSSLIARVLIKEANSKENKSNVLNCNYFYTAEVREKIKGDTAQIKFVSNGQLKIGGEYLVFFESKDSALFKSCSEDDVEYIATVYPERIFLIDRIASGFYGKDMLRQNFNWKGMPASINTISHYKKSNIDSELDENMLLIPYSELTAYIQNALTIK